MPSLRKRIREFRRRRQRLSLARHLVPAPTIHLGSDDCGWDFLDLPELEGATIISCGLGEEASFDVEFASRYRARVIILDPTPAAISHYKATVERLGQRATMPYLSGGRQNPLAYDMSVLTSGQLVLITQALWTEATKLKFYLPPDPLKQVSHSIINYQNRYATDTPHIEVETTTLPELLEKFDIKALPLMKLDIEGAECPVITNMLLTSIRPRQLLVEFDELNAPSSRGRENCERVINGLISAGYQMAHFDGRANFLFVYQR